MRSGSKVGSVIIGMQATVYRQSSAAQRLLSELPVCNGLSSAHTLVLCCPLLRTHLCRWQSAHGRARHTRACPAGTPAHPVASQQQRVQRNNSRGQQGGDTSTACSACFGKALFCSVDYNNVLPLLQACATAQSPWACLRPCRRGLPAALQPHLPWCCACCWQR